MLIVAKKDNQLTDRKTFKRKTLIHSEMAPAKAAAPSGKVKMKEPPPKRIKLK
jgi:hypothetical protein